MKIFVLVQGKGNARRAPSVCVRVRDRVCVICLRFKDIVETLRCGHVCGWELWANARAMPSRLAQGWRRRSAVSREPSQRATPGRLSVTVRESGTADVYCGS